MTINDRQYEYHIEPFYNKVKAEIYKVSGENQIAVISKDFRRGWFRKIDKQDYADAKEWAEDHLMAMFNANQKAEFLESLTIICAETCQANMYFNLGELKKANPLAEKSYQKLNELIEKLS